jgi:hypothetical protein
VLRASLLTASLLLGGAAGCGNAPSKGDCEKLIEHLVELEAAAAGGGAMPAAHKGELEQQKKKVRESVGLDFCRKEMSKDQLECGLKARTLEELDKSCDKS